MTDHHLAQIMERFRSLDIAVANVTDTLHLLLEKAKEVEGRDALADANPSLPAAVWDQSFPEGAKWDK